MIHYLILGSNIHIRSRSLISWSFENDLKMFDKREVPICQFVGTTEKQDWVDMTKFGNLTVTSRDAGEFPNLFCNLYFWSQTTARISVLVYSGPFGRYRPFWVGENTLATLGYLGHLGHSWMGSNVFLKELCNAMYWQHCLKTSKKVCRQVWQTKVFCDNVQVWGEKENNPESQAAKDPAATCPWFQGRSH